MLTSILHRSLTPNPRDRERRERERLARGLERIDDFADPSRRGPRGLAPIIRADSPHDAFVRVAQLASLATPRVVARPVVAV